METHLQKTLQGGRFKNVSASRSRIMSSIKAKHARSTETRLRSMLISHAIRGWKMHPKMIGNPDFIFPKEKLLLFVDGCFWHGCPRCGHIPMTNTRYWATKILRNKKRDRAIRSKLQMKGFAIIQVWECELKNSFKSIKKLQKIHDAHLL